MRGKKPSKEQIDQWATLYNSGKSLRQICARSGASYGTVHKYVNAHPAVTMRGHGSRPRPTG